MTLRKKFKGGNRMFEFMLGLRVASTVSLALLTGAVVVYQKTKKRK